MSGFCLGFYFLFLCGAVNAQSLEELAGLPPVLKGSSGLEFSKAGNIWTINDHGNPVLFQLSMDSFKITKTVHLRNKIKDWEDLSSDVEGNFYVGDFGNNRNNRKDLKIYKIPNPDSITTTTYNPEVIRFELSDQSLFPPPKGKHEFDIEAMVHYNGNLYLFSKSRGEPFKGKVKLYKLSDQPGEQTAVLIDSTFTGEGLMLENWITGATLISDKNILALLSHNKIFFYSCFEGDQFFKGKLTIFDLGHFSQKEAIDFDVESGQFFITDELTRGLIGGKIYKLALPKGLDNCN
ncbi:NHL repeat-containing protein [Marivirga aurantiaca]|nr:hypothetical protein [Marivirga aurantiaca]